VSIRQEQNPAEGEGGIPPAADDHGRQAAQPGGELVRRFRLLAAADTLWFGLVALAMALHAQLILTPSGRPADHVDSSAATRWYILAAAVLVIGWAGSYTNVSLVRISARTVRGLGAWTADLTRRQLKLVGAGLAVNLLSILILRTNWYSIPGGLLWVASLALIVTAFTSRSPAEGDGTFDSERLRGWLPGRRIEIAAIVLILAVALTMRLWRLGDLLPGMHGDEGEAGTQGLAILHGNLVSPFTRGWFNQSNIYYWSLAICMKIFGSGLFGLRTFAVISGVAALVFTYLIAREMFGPRVAIIAGFFLSFQSAALLFSRQEFSNVTVPPLQAGTFYFLVRGLRTRRHLDFAIAGLLAGLAWYYFAGGRLIGPVGAIFLGYLAVTRRSFLRVYWTRAAAFLIAMVAILTPFLAYYLAYPLPTNSYPNDRFIWLHYDDLAALYGTHSWYLIIWDQLIRTFAVLTETIDFSAMSALDYPVARPLEAALLILGLAWAFWRWRDTRFFLLSLWFWSTLIVGGVLTTDAPNLPRILGMLPVLAILIAILLDQFWLRITDAAAKLGGTPAWSARGLWAGGVLVAAATVISGIQNKQMYIDSWLNEHTNTIVTGQALYVHNQGTNYFYYDLGAPMVYWTHGDNRFINPYALGEDGANLPTRLPIIDNGANADRDANFMIWPAMIDYLPILKAYYPEGRERIVPLGDPAHRTDPLIGYVIPHQAIDRHRTLLARYLPTHGAPITRREPRLGVDSSASLPAHLSYPVQATWTGGLVAPTYDRYQLSLHAPAGTRLTIDGVTVFPSTPGKSVPLIMAAGPHTVALSAHLAGPHTRVTLSWSSSSLPSGEIARRYLWDNHIGRSWLAEVRPAPGGIFPQPVGPASNRVDGFIGYRSTGIAFGLVSGLTNRWRGVLTVYEPGVFTFDLNAFGSATLLIDGNPVVNDVAPGPDPSLANGQAELAPGRHRVELRYSWPGGTGYLELWWTPPGGTRQLFITRDLTPPGPAVWRPGTSSTSAPTPVSAPIPEPVPTPAPLIDQQ
jgi:4-amino-4-deoxy-L-arabinose transferase-like glycosyltransferase